MPLLSRPEKELRIEAIHAVALLADEKRFEHVRQQLQAQSQNADAQVAQAAATALKEMGTRLAETSGTVAMSSRGSSGSHTELVRSVPMDEEEAKALLHQVEQAGPSLKLDISTLRTGDMLEGRYKYIERIGKGAFGTVLLMEDTVVDDRLILKFLNPNVSEDEEMMKRFVHELRYSRKITHHNVIRIYDFLQVQGNYAISMEYFPSHTLGGEIVNEKPVETKKAVNFGIAMCTGKAVAHKVGVVHRDLKPANVQINNEGLLKIVDFGVAAAHREGDAQLTKTGYVIGSPKYMAPEQILGR
jgi:serine/threonine-protein kinase